MARPLQQQAVYRCPICCNAEGCECSDPGAAHEPAVLALEYEPPPCDTEVPL